MSLLGFAAGTGGKFAAGQLGNLLGSIGGGPEGGGTGENVLRATPCAGPYNIPDVARRLAYAESIGHGDPALTGGRSGGTVESFRIWLNGTSELKGQPIARGDYARMATALVGFAHGNADCQTDRAGERSAVRIIDRLPRAPAAPAAPGPSTFAPATQAAPRGEAVPTMAGAPGVTSNAAVLVGLVAALFLLR